MAEDYEPETPANAPPPADEPKVVPFPPDKIQPASPPSWFTNRSEWQKVVAGFTAAAMLFAWIVVMVDPLMRRHPPIPTLRVLDPTLTYYERIGREIHDYDTLVARMKADLKKEAPVKVLLGPYFMSSGIVGMLYRPPLRPERFLVLIDEPFFKEITDEEKEALVAHEVGHLASFGPLVFPDRRAITANQIIADRVAANYVRPQALIKLLDRLYYDYRMRRDALERIPEPPPILDMSPLDLKPIPRK